MTQLDLNYATLLFIMQRLHKILFQLQVRTLQVL